METSRLVVPFFLWALGGRFAKRPYVLIWPKILSLSLEGLRAGSRLRSGWQRKGISFEVRTLLMQAR